MAQAIMATIGVVSGSLGIVDFLQNNFPEKPNQGAAVRIKVGNPGDDNPGMVRQSGGVHLEIGDAQTLTIDSFSEGSNADYGSVAAGKNAVCIAWISVKMFDGSPGGAWTGDIGYKCGQNWYEQGESPGFLDKAQKEPYVPKCTWLDDDHSEGVPSAALKFKTLAYGHDAPDVANDGAGCQYTVWGADNGPINAQPGVKRSTNANRERLPWMEKKLIGSSVSSHHAEDMCNSETSWGPNFVSPDGMFCDMGTKSLAPLCSTQDVQGCVEIDNEEKVVKKRSFVAKRQVNATHKKYNTITRW